MEKKYESPEIEIISFKLTADVLSISKGEYTTSSGFYNEDEEEEIDAP